MRLVVAEPRPDANLRTRLGRLDVHERSDAVVLRLEDQSVPGQRWLCQRRQHRPHRRGILAPVHLPRSSIAVAGGGVARGTLKLRTMNSELRTIWMSALASLGPL